MGKLKELRKRVEAAGGPDRKLGAQLSSFALGYRYLSHECPYGDYLKIAAEADDGDRFEYVQDDPTASIDAAVSLVEKVLPDWRLTLEIEDGLARECYLTGPEYKSDCSRPDQMAQGRCGVKPEIGICAAFLRALEARERGE